MDARLRLRPLRLGRPAGAHPRPRAHAVGPRVPVRSEDRVRGGNDPRRRRGDRLAGAAPCRHRRRHRRHRDRDLARVHRRTARLEQPRRGRQRLGIHRGAAPADGLRHRRLRRGTWEPPHRHPLHRRSRHSPSGPSAGALRPSHRISSTSASSRGALYPSRRRVLADGRLVVRRLVLVVAVAAAIVACGDPNTGVGIEVIDAHVVRVIETGDHEGAKFQRLAVQLDGSLYRGEVVELEWDGRRALNENGFLAPGDRVLLTLSRTGNTRTYTISEVVRLPSLWPFVVILAVALVVVGRWKGLASLAGLGASIAVFLLAVLPAVRNGDDPLLATLVGSIGVLVVAVFVVHGFNRKSIAAMVGTLAKLVLVVAFAAPAFGG